MIRQIPMRRIIRADEVAAGIAFLLSDDASYVTGHTLHAETNGVDVYAAIDLLADKLDRLLVKHKEKQVDTVRRAESAARSGDFA